MIWKTLVLILGAGFLSVFGLLLYIVKSFSDGLGDAFGYSRSRRFWK